MSFLAFSTDSRSLEIMLNHRHHTTWAQKLRRTVPDIHYWKSSLASNELNSNAFKRISKLH